MDRLELEKMDEVFASLGNPMSGIGIIQRQFGMICMDDVYHYTDVTGFISIMMKQEFWASHVSFMNDRTEYLHGKELFRKKLNEKIAHTQGAKQMMFHRAMDSLDREMSDSICPTTGKDVFSISFTYDGDSLEMWRGYGKESGIAIGFSWEESNTSLPGMCLIREEVYEELLKKYNGNQDIVCPDGELLFFPISVLYEDDKKNELVNRVIELAENYLECTGIGGDEVGILTASQFLSDLIFKTNPLLKHSGFKGENECRFIDNFSAGAKEDYRIYYRNRGGLILPYVKYKMMDRNCRPMKQIPICDIVVGPGLKQQRVVDSVKYFLEKNNMEYLVDKVRASAIPYVEV